MLQVSESSTMYCKKQYAACSINVRNTGCAESMIVIKLLPLRPMDLLDAKTSSRCGVQGVPDYKKVESLILRYFEGLSADYKKVCFCCLNGTV